ncbi:MAG: hypothetical protein A2Z38_02300 [Planctomycetes bacterium RBG_19FT_COMBO_48_8]|nr:MAG: hypothetical protein A2Z38_02300 [Planctomycetes bacterium RBG_19FT_COMBO_48_8]
MPWYAFSGLYLVIWSALLIHCLFQREFYPIFGRRWGTQILWLVTFLFLNPLLTLVYFVFGFLLRPPKADEHKEGSQTARTGFGPAIAIACIGVWLVLFELPSRANKAEPVVILNKSGEEKPGKSNDSFDKFGAQFGTISARNSVQTLSSTSAGNSERVNIRNILLFCQNPNRLLDRATREFQKSLAQLPYVSKVTYYPYGTGPTPGGLLPDVFITINMPEIDEKTFLRSRYLKALIKWTVGGSLFAGTTHSVNNYTPPVVKFDIESQLEHESKMFGIESSRAKYKLAADGICREMIKSISKQFENLLAKYGQMPKPPEILNGTYHESPELSFLKGDKVEQLISGNGLLRNNHTVWRFADKRKTDAALAAYRDELNTLGWGQEDLGNEYLRMQKGNEHIYIFRHRQRDSNAGEFFWREFGKTASDISLIADYESYFTDDQMQKAMDALLDSDVEMKTLLIFEKYFRTPKLLERLQSIIEENPVHTLDGCLMLARYWADRGETDKGRESLLCARAMQRTEKDHNVRADEIKSLAEKLGDESLAEVPVAEEIFRQMGFINPEQLNEPVEIEKSINEPILFYRRLDDGELQTFALQIIRSQESSYLVPYHLLTVESRKGSSSSSENSGKVKAGGIWVADTSINALNDESKSIQLQVKSLGNEHFLFAITP